MRIENVDEKEKEDIGDPSIIQPELSYDELVQKSKDEMNFKQRLGYFWEYHKWKVLIPTAILLFIILFVQGYLKEIQPTDLNIKIVNCQDDALLSEYITSYSDEQVSNGMLEYGLNVEGYFVQPEVVDEYTAADNTVATSMQKYQSIVVSGQMDVTIATDWVLKEYGKSDVFMDLSEALPK